ncbi:MAG: hypothetical protein MUC64_07580 [Rubritepida sp.]|nr:hypothetical protein [Rubritepida sp.]
MLLAWDSLQAGEAARAVLTGAVAAPGLAGAGLLALLLFVLLAWARPAPASGGATAGGLATLGRGKLRACAAALGAVGLLFAVMGLAAMAALGPGGAAGLWLGATVFVVGALRCAALARAAAPRQPSTRTRI